jgi:hypothetical protein
VLRTSCIAEATKAMQAILAGNDLSRVLITALENVCLHTRKGQADHIHANGNRRLGDSRCAPGEQHYPLPDLGFTGLPLPASASISDRSFHLLAPPIPSCF